MRKSTSMSSLQLKILQGNDFIKLSQEPDAKRSCHSAAKSAQSHAVSDQSRGKTCAQLRAASSEQSRVWFHIGDISTDTANSSDKGYDYTGFGDIYIHNVQNSVCENSLKAH